MATVNNLTVDLADIFFKTYSSSATNDPVGTTNAIDVSGYTQVGWQAEGSGFKLEYTPDFFRGKVADKNSVVKRLLNDEEAKITFTLAESALSELQNALAAGTYTAAGTPGTDANKLEVGEKATFAQVSIVAKYVGKDGLDSCVFAGRCVAMGTVGLEYKKDAFTVVDFEFEIDSDENETAGATLFKLYEITAS